MPASPEDLRPLLDQVLAALAAGARDRGGPLPAGGPAAVAFADLEILPATGIDGALGDLTRRVAATTADPADPRCAGHLHCPPLAVAVAAELVAAALNPSLDSWDQGPSATALEPLVLEALRQLVFGTRVGAGVMTTGGTESNLMGLLLAREAGIRRVLCSTAAHFSVRRNAHLLGLDASAVVTVPVDAQQRMIPAELAGALVPSPLVVATAGTTDFGAVDPLPAIVGLCRAAGARLHVDASYGGGALFSDRLSGLLDGIAEADTVALDLHKLGWQPIAAGVFLTRDPAGLDPLAERAAYLNPADDEDAGYPSLLGNSLRTTRRFDAFKVLVTLRTLGREGLGVLVDACHALASHAASRIAGSPLLELAAAPVLTSVVFRVRGADNGAIRRRLLHAGTAVVGRTELDGEVWLKLTLLNPDATPADVDALLDVVVGAASGG